MCSANCLLIRDFNLNFAMKNDVNLYEASGRSKNACAPEQGCQTSVNDVNYSHVKYFDDFDDVLFDENLIQLVEFPTWSRIVNNV